MVDIERGRTIKGWKPRRLGGGKGGRKSYFDPNAVSTTIDEVDDKLKPKEKDADRDRDRDRDRDGQRNKDRDREKPDRERDLKRTKDRRSKSRSRDRKKRSKSKGEINLRINCARFFFNCIFFSLEI